MFILHIDSSANLQQSISRATSKAMVEELLDKYPDAKVKNLDLAKNPLPFIDDSWVEKKHGHLTDDLVKDVLEADIIVIGAPVYNFNVPASLKAYIDQILVAGQTFKYTPEGPVGLVPAGKKVYIAAASATPYDVLTTNGINYHGPYLKFIFNYIGISDVEILSYSGRGAEGIATAIEQSKMDIKQIVAKHDSNQK